ncbi:MAG: hypothetical protein K2Z81_27685, partial [Cyanobacteria bacterium]|nr:hypothetical protein [Cyanobacteriota bacterium]
MHLVYDGRIEGTPLFLYDVYLDPVRLSDMIAKDEGIEKLKCKFGVRRLIKTFLSLLLITLSLFPTSVGQCQTRRLPKAGFQSYSSGIMPPSPASTAPEPSSTGFSNRSSGLPYTPGVSLTEFEERTSQNATSPYNPGEPTLNMALCRWLRSRMPLLVWISPGLKLPDAPFEQLQSTRPALVHDMLKAETPFAELEQAKGWTPETNEAVARGIEQWRQFENEGLIKFGYVQDPKLAHV